MPEDTEKVRIPEFRTWSLENFGQVLKVSGGLEPEIFPYRVSVSKKSTFFRNAFDGVYKGQGVTVYGSERGKRKIASGVMVEHQAILAANDLGEIMVSKEIFQGNFWRSLTKYSEREMNDYNRTLSRVSLPPGWRRFGYLHSHPVADVVNSAILSFARGPKTDGVGVTWSGGDFRALVEPIREGHAQNLVEGIITPAQLGFMVATKKTIEVLNNDKGNNEDLIKTTRLDLPLYSNFEKLGIVLYAGKHLGVGNDIDLRRLIY